MAKTFLKLRWLTRLISEVYRSDGGLAATGAGFTLLFLVGMALQLAVLLLVLLGAGTTVALDTLSLPLNRIGMVHPAAGWAVLGSLGGGTLGLGQALKHMGRRSDLPKVYGAFLLLLLALWISAE